MKKMKWNKKNVKKLILLIFFITIFIFSSTKLYFYFKDLKKSSKEELEIIEQVIIKDTDDNKEEKVEIDFKKLSKINNDVVGWIFYNDNKINNPIVKTNNNEYYLNHSIYKKENQSGTIFMDYQNKNFDDKNVVLYGHTTIDKSKFGSLKELINDKTFFDNEDKHYIKILDKDNNLLIYQIFSYYIYDAEEYYITTNFNDNNSFNKFLKTIKRRSKKDFKIDLNTNDHIITLSTCYGTGNTNKRIVVHGVRIEEE